MRSLAAGAIVAILVGLALTATAGGTERRASASASGRFAIERAIRGCANRERRSRGTPALAASRVLTRAARLPARNMARQGFFDHTDPQGRSVGDRVSIFDRGNRFTYIGENIAAGYRSALSTCRGWMRSSGHRRNILDRRYTAIGGGFARGGPYGRYYVQVFGKPKVPVGLDR